MTLRWCTCGCPIMLRFRFNGLGWVAEFYDCRDDSPIEHCPDCGDLLRVLDLLSYAPLETESPV